MMKIWTRIRDAAIQKLNDDGVEGALTYQSTIALIEDIEHSFNDGQDGEIFDGFVLTQEWNC